MISRYFKDTLYVINFLKFRIVLFIISELIFFVSFFWAFFHSSVSPNIEIDILWPPKDIKFFDPIEIPLLNSFILVTSGFAITVRHYYIITNNLKREREIRTTFFIRTRSHTMEFFLQNTDYSIKVIVVSMHDARVTSFFYNPIR